MLEHTACRIHGRFPELLVGHLTKTFVTLGLDRFLVTATVVLDESLTLLIVPAVLAVVTLGALIKRRTSDIEVSLLDDLFHMTEEQSHNKGRDMGTVDIGIGHDDHFVITDLAEVERFRIFFGSKRDTEGGEDVTYLFGLEHLMLHRFLDVQDLTAKRQDSLVYTVTSGLRRTACRVSLDEEELALSRILGHTVREFTGQTTTAERRFAENGLTCVTGSDTCLRSQDDLLHDLLRIVRMLLQVVLQRLANGRVDHTGYFGVTEFGLGLSLELRFRHFYRDDRRETLAEIVRVDGRVTVFIFEFRLLQHLALLCVFLHDTREGSAEACYVRTTFDGIDVIDVRVYVLVKIGVVNHRYLYRRTVFVGAQMNHLGDQRRTGTVDVTNELRETLLRVELLLLAVTLCINDTFVLEHDLDTRIQESELTHTVRKDIPVVHRLGKDRVVRPELHKRTGLALLPVTGCFRLLDGMNRRQRFTLLVILTVYSTLAIYLHMHFLRERIHAAHTHAVQTTGNFIGILVELTTGVKHGHYDLQRRLMLFRVHVHRNTTTVILHGNGVILIDMHGDLVAETGECLINRVVHYLVNKVMQTLQRDITDIHRRAFAHRL